VFHLVPLFGVLTTLTVLAIPSNAIDHEQARGLGEDGSGGDGRPAGWHVLLDRRPLLVLAAGIALFHFANAPMLPLLTQKLALAHPGAETMLVAACVVTAQIVSVPTALLVGARADSWGRKPLLLAGFGALPLRGVLYTASDNPVLLIAVQALDGVSLGILDALIALVLADIMRGTGRYNAARGVLGTVQGIGGSSSNVVAGLIVVTAGYGAAFLTLAAIALIAFVVILAAMPETGRKEVVSG
jgi:MFS family permease